MKSLKPGSLRERMKEQTRDLILDAVAEALVAGEPERTTHDALAKAVGLSKMTVYRYFPDRKVLMQALWDKIGNSVGPKVRFPKEEADLVDALEEIYTGFDAHERLFTMSLSTAEGRALRLAKKDERVAAYTKATATAVRKLPEDDRKLATAVLQILHASHAWLEMRDQWDLNGREIARAMRWAMRTLLADLKARGSKPLES